MKISKNKSKKVTIILLIILLITVIIFVAFFVRRLKKMEVGTAPVSISENQGNDESGTATFAGELTGIKEKTIDVIDLNKRENDPDNWMKTGNYTFNYDSKTPVFFGNNENKRVAYLYDLKLNQTIAVEYDKKSNDAINIYIINELSNNKTIKK
jgi:hypothetical protein